jgi:tetratricopeptide (TPR) repeat protein
MSGQARILGVYSKTAEVGAGMGATQKKAMQRTYWFVRMLPDDSYELRPLNANHVPAGPASILSKKEFMSAYEPEPDFYIKKTLPFMVSLQKKLEKGEEYFKAGDLDAAEKEFCKALNIDDENPKANVALGAVYSEKCDYAKLKSVMRRVMGNDQIFNEEQRRLFNDFGINLRKSKLLGEAVAYYSKALDLSPRDENLHFNIARAYFDGQELDKCRDHLLRALDINPDFKQARQFLEYCDTGLNGNTKKIMHQMSE